MRCHESINPPEEPLWTLHCVFDLTAADDEEESEEDEVPDTVIQYQGYTFRTPGGAALDQQVVNHNLQVS